MAEDKRQQKEQKEKADDLGIIRMAGRDIRGNYSIVNALMQIKGIGYNMARAIGLAVERKNGINMYTKIGTLSEAQLSELETTMKEPTKLGIPNFMLNRRNDVDTGVDMHLVGTDLTVSVRQDIDRDIRAKAWRGFRHMYGQRARGQRTRSTGRTGATIGVTKGKAMPGAGGEAAAKGPSGAPAGGKAAPSASAASVPTAAAKPAEKTAK